MAVEIAETWAGPALALGWSTAELFGASPTFPLACAGGLAVECCRRQADLVAVTADAAMICRRDGSGARMVRRDYLPDGLVLVWDMGGGNVRY